MTVFWEVAPCSLVETDRRFSGAYCLHHHQDDPIRRRENLKYHKWAERFNYGALPTVPPESVGYILYRRPPRNSNGH
jgi:hypothetical protein